jgi:DNA repair protein RecN (Recombination protein N)
LIFDEVDAGIGGTTGTAIGQALVNLADRHQVLVVTHLAQVAAFATAHKVVRKATAKDSVDVSISNLERDDRVTELARMLSGKPDSASAREHAEELLG